MTDDLGSYRAVAEHLGVEHRICSFHRMRWAIRELKQLHRKVEQVWKPFAEEAMAIIRSRAPDGGWWVRLRLRRAGRKSPEERLQLLLARLSLDGLLKRGASVV